MVLIGGQYLFRNPLLFILIVLIFIVSSQYLHPGRILSIGDRDYKLQSALQGYERACAGIVDHDERIRYDTNNGESLVSAGSLC